MTEPSTKTPPPGIPYWLLATIAICLVVGVVVGLFINVSKDGAATSLTPMELLGFFVSVLIGGASIVLAIVAISLGKMSETALTDRGDEHLRLQTEIYTKTTEALQKIASSTDVTEKRIEDMISGRVSDISHDLARSFPGSRKSPDDMEREIRQSIMGSIRRKESEEQRREEKKKEKEQEEAYQTAHKQALLAFANKQHTKVSKLEHGSPDDEGEGLFDALYIRKNEKIALSTFRPGSSDTVPRLFIINALSELQSESINSLVVLLFTDDETENKSVVIDKVLGVVPDDLSDRVQIVVSPLETVEETISDVDLNTKSTSHDRSQTSPKLVE